MKWIGFFGNHGIKKVPKFGGDVKKHYLRNVKKLLGISL
jgi:hypothetical protein